MTAFAGERLVAEQSLPGVVIVPQVDSVGRLIDALQELIETQTATDLEDQIVFLKP